MARPSAEEVLKKQKEAKLKKVLIIAVPLLLILVGYNLLNLRGGSEDTASSGDEAAETTDGSASVDGATPAGGAPAPAAPAPAEAQPVDPATGQPLAADEVPAAVVPAEPTDLSDVSDSDPVPAADEGQLVSFSRFVGDDPFVQLVEVPDAEEAQEEEPEEAGGGAPSGGSSADIDLSGGTALIEINGEIENVEINGTFPLEDPAFTLVAIEEGGIEFGLVDGSFATGIDTLDLDVGKSITLVSQPDGFRFTIKLIGFPAEFEDPGEAASELP